jgi:uncharacterized membrane protein
MPIEIFNRIHPILVHFPIAFIVIGTLYDLYVAWRDGRIAGGKGLAIWIAAFAGAWLAVSSGPGRDARGNTDALDIHSLLANLTAWATTLLVAFRFLRHLQEREFQRGSLTLYVLLSFVCSALVLGTGYYGGKMVYDDGVGVSVNGKPVNPPQPYQQHRQPQS